jgi:hypothetical protein
MEWSSRHEMACGLIRNNKKTHATVAAHITHHVSYFNKEKCQDMLQHFQVFIYSLFNDAITSSNYTASNDRMVNG